MFRYSTENAIDEIKLRYHHPFNTVMYLLSQTPPSRATKHPIFHFDGMLFCLQFEFINTRHIWLQCHPEKHLHTHHQVLFGYIACSSSIRENRFGFFKICEVYNIYILSSLYARCIPQLCIRHLMQQLVVSTVRFCSMRNRIVYNVWNKPTKKIN